VLLSTASSTAAEGHTAAEGQRHRQQHYTQFLTDQIYGRLTWYILQRAEL